MQDNLEQGMIISSFLLISSQPCKRLASILHVLFLKHSQYKNDAIQFKNFLILKLPPFSVTYTAKEKRRQFQT